MFEAREIAFRAAKLEYAIVFPPYYASQIFEGKHQPGTIAYSNELMWRMLEETCSELSRNGVKKIILDNGHGGNNNFLAYFCQSQLDKPHDYVVVLFQPRPGKEAAKKIEALKRSKLDGHAGEEETSMMNVIRPDLVNNAAAKDESGSDLARLKVPYGYTGIWWYARYPNHYAGDGSMYSRELGEMLLDTDAAQLAELIRFLKKDNSIKELQEQFYKKTMDPLLK
jgi:creatinine amidohydrolase